MDAADSLEALADIGAEIGQANLDEQSTTTLRSHYKKRHAELNK